MITIYNVFWRIGEGNLIEQEYECEHTATEAYYNLIEDFRHEEDFYCGVEYLRKETLQFYDGEE